MNDAIRDFQATVHCLDGIPLGTDHVPCLAQPRVATGRQRTSYVQDGQTFRNYRSGSAGVVRTGKIRQACPDGAHYDNLIESGQCDSCGIEDV